MKTRKPLFGLLTFSFYSVMGSLIFVILYVLLIGVVAQITELDFVVQIFLFNATCAVPYIVIQKSEGTPKWEPYLLAMPIKRKNLATILYLNVFIASLFAIPIIGVVWGVGFIFNEVVMATILYGGFMTIAFAYGSMLLFAALIYPIGSTKLGQRNIQGLFFGCLIAAIVINVAILFGGRWLGLSNIIITSLCIAIAGAAFVVSLLITKAMYARADF